jgi:hypothetical protein
MWITSFWQASTARLFVLSDQFVFILASKGALKV